MLQQDVQHGKPIYRAGSEKVWQSLGHHAAATPDLLPLIGVERCPSRANTWLSKSSQPWLQLNINLEDVAGRSIELTYEASLLDVLARPIIRLVLEEERIEDMVLPAPIGGKGVWIGYISEGIRQILISPVDVSGLFGFRILKCHPIGKWRKLLQAVRYHPFSASWSILVWLAGYRHKARRRIQRALGTIPLRAHHHWLKSRTRIPDWVGLDAPRVLAASHLRIILLDADSEQERKMAAVLGSQPRLEWSTLRASSNAKISQLIEGLQPKDFIIVLNAGDQIAPEAPSILAEAAARFPADIFYADELDLAKGSPRFKPDWSPVLAQSIDVLGTACFYRVNWVRDHLSGRSCEALKSVFLSFDDTVVHIKRLLISCSALPTRRTEITLPLVNSQTCSIIIPIRDQHELLQQCLDSILSNDSDVTFEIIIVDNDSTEAETAKYLSDISREARIRILHSPGTFNFSALCNAGAKAARFDMLVFLNNDTKVLSPDWLQKLTAWACRPDIGAVGAKLLFPNDKVQHAGVALGLHGTAAHFEAGSPPDSVGYFGRLEVPHELSAVTGACLVIERSKFDLVGGFDEVNLPVEYGDIDLCLKLQERGLRNLIEPRARLVHLESASRGNIVPSEIRYKDETAYFKQRWFSVIRNDPYLHPALSIETTEAALG
ncbi:glycosyltransferase family 2 protein [Methylocella sp. CPCC 101449]|uniref:glycosyltransferase family 2 protein n=1 Tax=Methylocella sp. CPCC 101449 TaxID=2987531 RepID=UPI00288EF76F|nr:glycosyltransferase family 2 protein [Methylocella sp. CPCC 101449]MDT2019447.1 glycosyltransferase family 2 protein [Methylocella sp. CPCC 101449]